MKKSIICLLLISCLACKNDETRITAPAIKLPDNSWIDEVAAMPADSIAAYATASEAQASAGSVQHRVKSAYAWAVYHSYRSSYHLSNQYYDKVLVLIENSGQNILEAKIHNAIGNNNTTIGEYPKALSHLLKALKIYEVESNKPGISLVHAAIGEVYLQKDNLELAQSHLAIALETLKDQKTNPAYLKAAHTLANVYGMKGDLKSAMAIDREGIRITDSINAPKLKSPFVDNIAQCFLFSNQLDSAAYYFNECLKIDIAGGNNKQIADTYSNLGHLHLLEKDYARATQFTNKSIEMLKDINARHNLLKSYTILADIYKAQGMYQKAMEIHGERFTSYKEMMAEKKESAVAEFAAVYETQKKENTIQLLQQEKQITNLKIKDQKSRIDMLHLMLLAFILLISGLVTIGYFWKSRQKLKNILDREKAVREMEELERIRIAKDIHDDLGSGLAKINFLSDKIVQQTGLLPDLRNTATSIRETASRIVDNMRDMIWALNSNDLTLHSLIARMREYATDYLEDYPIVIHYDIPNLPDSVISKEIQRELFMVLKECLTNLAKHSQASDAYFTIGFSNNRLSFKISDNGIGFIQDSQTPGNGLRNMQSRACSIGTFEVKSNPSGTSVAFAAELPRNLYSPSAL